MTEIISKKIICDNCKKEIDFYNNDIEMELFTLDTLHISFRYNIDGYYNGGSYPIDSEEKHFCSKKCLLEWLDRKL